MVFIPLTKNAPLPQTTRALTTGEHTMTVYHDWFEEWLDSLQGQVWLEQFDNDASYGWPWEI